VEGDEEMNDLSMNNPKTKLMVWLIIFILIGGAFYWFLIKPQFVQINEFEKQISVKQQKLADLKLARQREKVLLAENKQFQDRIESLQKILPPERDEFLFGEEFQTVAKLCGVKIMNLDFPQKSAKGTLKDSVPFTISVSAEKMENINWFFIHIAKFPQIISLSKVDINKGSSGYSTGTSSKNAAYNLQLSGIIYLSARK
jgi:Tfp pilus assembly protein PilO